MAHVGGIPVEELAPLALAGGALWMAALVSMRARVSRLLQAGTVSQRFAAIRRARDRA